MYIFSTISVIANLCTIYSTYKSSKIDQEKVNKALKETIAALDLFKETHTNAQALREECRTFLEEPRAVGGVSANSFQTKLRLMRDKVQPFSQIYHGYFSSGFETQEMEIKIGNGHILNKIKAVDEAVKQLKCYIEKMNNNGAPLIEWESTWHIGNFSPQSDLDRLGYFAESVEGDARLTLLYSDGAITNSITLLHWFAEKTL